MTTFNKVFYSLVKWSLFFILKIYNRLTVRRLAPLPERNYIAIANHCSNLDPIIVGAAFPGRFRILAKSELYEPFIFGRIVKALGTIPVKKEDSQSAGASLRLFLRLLSEGENVLLFPEGGRSMDGKLQPLEGGVALIALKSGAPIVPAYVAGTFEAMPPGAKFVKPARLSAVIGEAIDTGEYASLGKEGRNLLLRRLEEELASLEPKARALL